MYDLHNVINLSVDVRHVLVLGYYLLNNKICLKQINYFSGEMFIFNSIYYIMYNIVVYIWVSHRVNVNLIY